MRAGVLDHSLISEDELEVIRFSVNGKNYTLGLSHDNAAKFHELLQPFVDAARVAPETDYRRINPREIRDWARTQGIPIAHRGTIPYEIIDAFNDAQLGS